MYIYIYIFIHGSGTTVTTVGTVLGLGTCLGIPILVVTLDIAITLMCFYQCAAVCSVEPAICISLTTS